MPLERWANMHAREDIIDDSVTMCHVSNCEKVHLLNRVECDRKRPMEINCCRSQRRRASAGDLSNIKMMKEELELSLARDPSEKREELRLKVGESINGELSIIAEQKGLIKCHCENMLNRPCAKKHNIQDARELHQASSNCIPAQTTAGNVSGIQLQSLASTPRSMRSSLSLKLSTYSLIDITVLCIDIKGFTSACATMPAGRIGEWIADFYERVDDVAAAHGVSKIEVRGDCCVCVAGVAGRVPSHALASTTADPHENQATRMLAFAAALHADLATLPSSGPAATTTTRMGIASGKVAFLVSDAAGGPDAAPFASVRGDAVDAATRMEALAAAGEALVHKTAADRWAAEGRLEPPATVCVEVKGGGLQRAAVFDCAARAFRRPTGSIGSTDSSGSGFGAAVAACPSIVVLRSTSCLF